MKGWIRVIAICALFGGGGDSMASERESSSRHEHKEYWTCPMHPQVKSDKPGQCPICGMNLVLKKQEPKPKAKPQGDQSQKEPVKKSPTTLPKEHAPVKLSVERQQMIGVKTDFVSKEKVTKHITAVGRVAFDPELYSAQNDFVEAMLNYERLKNSPLSEAVESAKHMVQSAQFRLKVMGISEEQIQHIRETRSIDEGILVKKPGESSWIYADIFESDLPDVKSGLNAVISGDTLRGKKLHGTVLFVDRVIDPSTRTVRARILAEKNGIDLRPQSYVDVSIDVPMEEQVVVPLDAVLSTGKESWVFITEGQGYFEPKLITIKAHVGNKVLVSHGLKGGEKIVTSANFLIDSESRLRFVASDEKTPKCPEGQAWDVSMSMCM